MNLPIAVVLAVQVAQAGVHGTVRDELSGAPLSGVVVSLTELNLRVLTDERGRFRFDDLTAGPHHLSVTRHGYRSRTLHALVPRVGVVDLAVALRPRPLELGGLVVEPRLPIRGVDPADRSGRTPSIDIAAIRHHPMLPEPDALRALEGGDVAVLPEAPAGLHVRGGAAGHTAFEIDGLPVLGPLHAAGLFSAWNPDALDGVRLDRGPGSALPTLSGTVVGRVVRPGATLHGTSALSTTHARTSLEGPVTASAGFVVGVRQGFPGGLSSPREAARLRGETSDLIVAFDMRIGGGELRVLAYGSENEVSAATVADTDAGEVPRSGFEWATRTLGAVWSGSVRTVRLQTRAWEARGTSDLSVLGLPTGPVALGHERTERGVASTAVVRTSARGEVRLGARLTRGSATYAVRATDPFGTEGSLVMAGLVAGTSMPLGERALLEADIDLTATSAGTRVSPRVGASVRLSPMLSLSAGVARRHQFTQSLRNEESVLGTVLPTDFSVHAGSRGIPIARADEVEARIELRPAAGVSIGGQLFARSLGSVLFVAPSTGALYAGGTTPIGRARVAGAAVEVSATGSRYALVADYVAQRVRNRVPGLTYAPSYAPAHRLQAGLSVHLTPTFSVRLVQTGLWGRRSTSVAGPLEWEACNLADGGCELSGGAVNVDTPGDARPGPYLRTDLGVRKHWHVRMGRRDTSVALYGTLVNVLDRHNVLTYAIDPVTGARSPIGMLSLAPLVVGLEIGF